MMNLKSIRNERHLSQEQLAALSGLNVRTIQRLENGGTPSKETLKCIAAALEIDIDTLVSNGMPSPKVSRHKLSYLLLFAASMGMLIAAKSESVDANTAAFFYLASAVCFVAASLTMAWHGRGDLGQAQT